MNWVDIVIIVVALIGGIVGWSHGLIRMVFTLLGLIIGVALAGQWSDGLTEVLSPSGAQWAYLTSFAIIVIIVVIIANICGRILQTFFKLIMMGWLDSIGGMILGFLLGALLVAAVLTSMALYVNDPNSPGGYNSTLVKAIGDSVFAELLIDHFGLLLGLLPGKFDSVKEFFN
jgi:membrane protein required for colicin V production